MENQEKTSMQINMEKCISWVKNFEVKEQWMEGALRENIETMEETMNMWLCNPNPFWQNKFIKLYKNCLSLQK